MSGTEFLVVVFGLFLGYWIVSQFASGSKTKKNFDAHQVDTNSQAQSGQARAERTTEAEQRRSQQDPEASASWSEILNVSPDADIREIQRAYKTLMSQYHPDKVASLGLEVRELCERKTTEINTAYDRAIAERGNA